MNNTYRFENGDEFIPIVHQSTACDECNVTELKRVKCRNYSAPQKAEFDADTETTKYSELAGW